MPWFRMWAHNRAGHRRETYRYLDPETASDPEILEAEMESEWERWVYYRATGGYEQVDALPESAHRAEVKRWESAILNASWMLRILDDTPIEDDDNT